MVHPGEFVAFAAELDTKQATTEVACIKELAERVLALEAALANEQAKVASLQGTVTTLEAKVAALEKIPPAKE